MHPVKEGMRELRCHECGNRPVFFELVEVDTNHKLCPRCHGKELAEQVVRDPINRPGR